MFDMKEMRQRLLKIREDKLLTYGEMCEEIGIGWTTLMRFLHNEETDLMMKTKRLIRDFIEENEQ